MIRMAIRNIFKSLLFYTPYIVLLIFLVFVFSTLLSLSIASRQIYAKSGSSDQLAVFEGNRACVFASLVPESYGEEIAAVPHVVDITGEVRHLIVYEPKKSLTLTGIEHDKFREFKNINIEDEEYQSFGRDPEGVIIGEKVKKTFNWEVGETVSLRGLKFNVRGVFSMPMSMYDGMIVFHKDYLQKLFKKEGSFTAFTLKIDDQGNRGKVSEAVEKLFADHPAGIVCAPEKEFWGRSEKQMGSFGKHVRVLTILSALLLFSVLINGTIFKLKNRGTEISALHAEGFSKTGTFSVLFLEPLMVATIAALGGSLLAFIIWINNPSFGGDQAVLPPIMVTPAIVAVTVVLVFAVTAIFSGISAVCVNK